MPQTTDCSLPVTWSAKSLPGALLPLCIDAVTRLDQAGAVNGTACMTVAQTTCLAELSVTGR